MILSIFQGVLEFIYSTMTHLAKFGAEVVSFVLHNIVTIGIVIGALALYRVYLSRQGAVGAKKRI